MGLFVKGSRSLRIVSVIAAVTMAYSSSAQGFNAVFSLVGTNLAIQFGGGGGDYTDSPYTPDTLPNPTTQPDNRGDFYSSDDLTQIQTAQQIQQGNATAPDMQNLSNPVYVDPGDNSALYGDPVPADKSMGDPNSVPGGGFSPPTDTGSTSSASTTGTTSTSSTTGTTTSSTGTIGSTTSTSSTSSTTGSTTGTTSTTATTGLTGASGSTSSTTSLTTGTTGTTTGTTGTTGSTGGGTTGSIGAGGTGAHAGGSFPWEGARPGGGSEFAPGQVNTQTGNRLTTVPIVGWKTRGGVPFGLTLYHNSQDATDLGWGKGWRSNVDFSITYTGRNLTNNLSTAVVAYPDGMRLVFKYQPGTGVSTWGGVFYPPTGFYDTLIPLGIPTSKPTGWLLRTKSQMTYFFNASGVLTSYKDRYGNTINVNKTPTSIHLQDASGNGNNVIDVSSIPYNNIESLGLFGGMSARYYNHITAPGSRAWDLGFVFRSGHDITLNQITYPNLNTARPYETFTYGPGDGTAFACAPMTQEVDVIGRHWYQTYDSTNSELTFQLPVNANPSTDPKYTYNYYGGSTEFVKPSGNKIIEYYNEGVLAQIKDEAGYFTQITYDKYYNVSYVKDPRGNLSHYVYDAFANMLSSQDQRQITASKQVNYVYNSWNDILSVQDTRGVTTYYNRGSVPGTLINVTDGNGHVLVTNTYNGDGSLASTSSEGVTTTLGYDSNYLPNYVSTPDGNATVTYGTGTLVGKPISVIDNRSRQSTFAHDDWGRLTSTTRFDSAVASVAMNTIGYVNTATDVLGHQTTLNRDGIGRVTSVLNARGDAESYNFTTDGFLYSVQNGNGYTRTYGYTARGELSHLYFADGTSEQYKFDGNGNQTQRINGLYQTTNYGYDNSDNLTSVTYPSGTPTAFTYDNDGRQLTMTDSTGSSSWQYDNGDNITQLTTPQGVMSYAYDQWNRRTALTEGTAVTNYGYTTNKLTSINKSADSVSTTLNYDSYGRLVTKNDGATTSTYGYDGNDRVNSIVHANSSSGAILQQETYNYDYANNLNTKIVNSVLTTYGYDNIDQLTSESNSSFTNLYSYDHNGNRLTKTANGIVETYSYDNADKLQTRSGLTGTYNYTYDNCGRTSTISGPTGTRTFTWDYEDRLTNLSGGGVPSTNYGYNGVGARTSKSNSTGSRTYKRNGVGVTAPVLSDGVATMVPGIAEKSGGVTNTVLTDRLGSTKAMASSGASTFTADFDAFGKVVSTSGTTTTQKGFVGGAEYQEDGESGYKLLGHRYYDADSGRFLSRDPSYDGNNWYSYASNSPGKYIDPTGHQAEVVDFFGGWGDHLASGGLVPALSGFDSATEMVRSILGVDNQVDKSSDSYKNGQGLGRAHEFLMMMLVPIKVRAGKLGPPIVIGRGMKRVMPIVEAVGGETMRDIENASNAYRLWQNWLWITHRLLQGRAVIDLGLGEATNYGPYYLTETVMKFILS